MDPKVLPKMFRAKKLILVGLLAAGTQGALAQATGQWRDPQHMFDKVCSLCHMIGVGPNLLGRQLPVSYVESVIRHGRTAMPAFLPTEFSAKEINELAQMIHQSSASQGDAQAPGGGK